MMYIVYGAFIGIYMYDIHDIEYYNLYDTSVGCVIWHVDNMYDCNILYV